MSKNLNVALKRPRASSSRHAGHSSSFGGQSKQFTSPEAQKRYQDKILNKLLVEERALIPHCSHHKTLYHAIVNRNWEQFMASPPKVVVNLVKEFYSNAIDRREYTIMVRGKLAKFDKHTINAHYGLPTIEKDEYHQFLESSIDHVSLLQSLGGEQTFWNFSSSDLDRKMWFLFICARFIPTRHTTDVTKNIAYLLFSIIEGMSIDVGQVIQANIVYYLKDTTTGGLPHPALIFDLCIEAGVSFTKNEHQTSTLSALDDAHIQKIQKLIAKQQ